MACVSKEIVVAFGVDVNYAPHLAVAIASVVANAPGALFRFMIIHDGVPAAHQAQVEAVASGHAFEWHEIADSRLLEMEGFNHITRASYFRFAIPTFAPVDAKRVIYLDCDLVALGDLRELAKVDLQGNMIGAVCDAAVDSEAFGARWGFAPQRLSYFNSGVLVLDMEMIRNAGGFEPAIKTLREHREKCIFGDQCALNVMMWDRWTSIDPTWNVQRRMVMAEGTPCYLTSEEMQTGLRPGIIHFTETNKPWAVDAYHPYVWTYYKYLRQTPYWRSVNAKAKTTTMKHVRRYVKTAFNLARLKTKAGQ
ncbi:MAG: glycosyltransferase family 8 protein [Alphaproteobacteria bacterium]|nr:MAG: glycosyltransferase family 8 protein [Alphaproteobacteria bacterium]